VCLEEEEEEESGTSALIIYLFVGPAGPESENPGVRERCAVVGHQKGEAQVEAECQQKLHGECLARSVKAESRVRGQPAAPLRYIITYSPQNK